MKSKKKKQMELTFDKPGREYLLVMDSEAPDARELFDRILYEKYDLTVEQFRQDGVRTGDDFTVKYELNGLVLETSADYPEWKLYKKD